MVRSQLGVAENLHRARWHCIVGVRVASRLWALPLPPGACHLVSLRLRFFTCEVGFMLILVRQLWATE